MGVCLEPILPVATPVGGLWRSTCKRYAEHAETKIKPRVFCFYCFSFVQDQLIECFRVYHKLSSWYLCVFKSSPQHHLQASHQTPPHLGVRMMALISNPHLEFTWTFHTWLMGNPQSLGPFPAVLNCPFLATNRIWARDDAIEPCTRRKVQQRYAYDDQNFSFVPRIEL